MVDLSQVLLVIVITILTALLTVIGVQIVYILREVRRSLEKMNKMLDDVGMITKSIAHPIVGLGGAIESLRSIGKTIDAIGLFFSRRKKANHTSEDTKEGN